MRRFLFVLLLAGLVASAPVFGSQQTVVGTAPPEWTAREWLNSPPLTLSGLKGKVVVVRWWTGPGCPYCAESAPSLDALWEKYRSRGLVVIGMYHHKSHAPLTPEHVAQQADHLGIHFPIGIDRDWKTLHSWWLDRQSDAAWTSVSFVLDRAGVIRFVHPGGSLVEGTPDFAALEKAVVAALKE